MRLTQPFKLSRLTPRLLGSLILLSLLTTGLSACSRNNGPEVTIAAQSQTVDGPSDLENNQTNVKITVPANWVRAEDALRGSADIYASYPAQELYASVLSESKTVLSQFDLEDNAEQYRLLIQRELNDYESSARTNVERINGDPAVQYEIRGRVNGIPVVYLHTTVQGDTDYYQVVGVTTADQYPDNKDTLESIIESFEALEEENL